MRVVGEPARPSVLFCGVDPVSPKVQAMLELAPSWKIIPRDAFNGGGKGGIRLSDWDVVVIWDYEQVGEAPFEDPGIYTLSFCTSEVPVVIRSGATSNEFIPFYVLDQPSPIMQVADNLQGDLANLVRDDLIPWLADQEMRPRLRWAQHVNRLAQWNVAPGSRSRPFVLDADDCMIAGDFLRCAPRGHTEIIARSWILPFLPEYPARWLSAALQSWHELEPDRFPVVGRWRTREVWQTKSEMDIQAELTALLAERDAAEAAFRARIAEVEARSVQSAVHADRTLRRLLTEQGDELVAAAIEALTSLGFTVVNVDENLGPGKGKREDLRVGDPSDAAWANITEVKGYLKGAQGGDLYKIGKYRSMFENETGAAPTSMWYLVNQFANADPDTRQVVLRGADELIGDFAEDGGVVIDTRELFKLLTRVERGMVARESARKSLRYATGVYTAPESD